MKNIRVAINGFGRIGRVFFRNVVKNPIIEVSAINDLADINVLTHLLKYDSIYGLSDFDVSCDSDNIIVNKKKIPFSNYINPHESCFKNTDIVLDATGVFKTREELSGYFNSSIKKVLLASPPFDDSIKMVVLGVNDQIITDKETVLSNASCTTNSIAPLIKLIDDNFKIKDAYVTTIHSYTTDQNIHDSPHRDFRRARSAANSIIPTTTGAAKALTNIFPHLKFNLGGCGIRVPVINGSLTDLTCVVGKKTDVQSVNNVFKFHSKKNLKKILQYIDEPIVSRDVIGNNHSCVFDSQLTSVLGSMIKIVSWYDNENGYSNRLIDVISKWF
tara:strand:+ start:2330 stop:3319 length:990 start_codon:yes stop_codon:yes gene_type:complete